VGATLIKQSAVVDVRSYLAGLWSYVQNNTANATWLIERVHSIDELWQRFDVVVVAAGPSSAHIWKDGTAGLKFSMNRGRIFSCVESAGRPLRHAIVAGEYAFPHPSREGVIVCGATKENISLPGEEAGQAENEVVFSTGEAWEPLRDKVAKIYPPVAAATTPISSWHGYRMYIDRGAGKSRLPIVCKHDTLANVWLITGFGSRGLVHHALAARHLVAAIARKEEGVSIEEDDDGKRRNAEDYYGIPKELRVL
jgi:glycine/D-amino acid oxidase-like deaminating enzyme